MRNLKSHVQSCERTNTCTLCICIYGLHKYIHMYESLCTHFHKYCCHFLYSIYSLFAPTCVRLKSKRSNNGDWQIFFVAIKCQFIILIFFTLRWRAVKLCAKQLKNSLSVRVCTHLHFGLKWGWEYNLVEFKIHDVKCIKRIIKF